MSRPPQSGHRATVAVVIVTRDRAQSLSSCLASIAAQSPAPDEVIIVAGSEASCPDDLLASFNGLAPVLIDCHEHNICKSRNAGLHACNSELVLFIDDDATARPGWVRAYLDAFARTPSPWAVGGHVYDSRRSPPTPEFAFGVITPSGLQIAVRDPQTSAVPRGYHPNVKGCNFGLRRQRALGLGGFDPFYAFAFDEADLMLTIAASGGSVVHEPAAVAAHAHAPGHYRQSDPLDRDWRTEYASHTMLMLKHSARAGRIWGWLVIARRLGKLAGRAAMGVLTGRLGPRRALAVIADAIGGVRDARQARPVRP